MNEMKKSVVIATYNGEKYIEEQLLSILGQDEKPDEVIITDDGSNDRTLDIVRGFISDNGLTGTWKLIHNSNKGISGNFFNGIAHSTGDIVYLCDQDDTWNTDKIRKMQALFEKDKSLSCVISSIDYIDSKGHIIKCKTAFSSRKTHEVSFEEMLCVCSYLGMASAFRRDVIDSVNYKLGYETSHDWALFISALKKGKVVFYGTPLVKYRLHGNNASGVTGNTLSQKRLNLINRQKYHISFLTETVSLTDEQKEKCRDYINFLDQRIIRISGKETIKTVFGIFSYISRGYTLRNIVGDLAATRK